MTASSLRLPSITAVVSLVFAVSGFTYNAWRLEQSEENNITRDAAFQILTELSALEQVIYANHYDNNLETGSPRLGWVKIGLINDLAVLMGEAVEQNAQALYMNWSNHWAEVRTSRDAVESLVADADALRQSVKDELSNLD